MSTSQAVPFPEVVGVASGDGGREGRRPAEIDLTRGRRRARADDAAGEPGAGRLPDGRPASARGGGRPGLESAAGRRGGRRQVPDAGPPGSRPGCRCRRPGPASRRPRRSPPSRRWGATSWSSRCSARRGAGWCGSATASSPGGRFTRSSGWAPCSTSSGWSAIPGHDLRVFVLGGRVLGAMRRHAPAGEWRTNVSLGGRAEPCRLDADGRAPGPRAPPGRRGRDGRRRPDPRPRPRAAGRARGQRRPRLAGAGAGDRHRRRRGRARGAEGCRAMSDEPRATRAGECRPLARAARPDRLPARGHGAQAGERPSRRGLSPTSTSSTSCSVPRRSPGRSTGRPTRGSARRCSRRSRRRGGSSARTPTSG